MLVGREDVFPWEAHARSSDILLREKPVPHPHGCIVLRAGFFYLNLSASLTSYNRRP